VSALKLVYPFGRKSSLGRLPIEAFFAAIVAYTRELVYRTSLLSAPFSVLRHAPRHAPDTRIEFAEEDLSDTTPDLDRPHVRAERELDRGSRCTQGKSLKDE
jgi:hypothetical protein